MILLLAIEGVSQNKNPARCSCERGPCPWGWLGWELHGNSPPKNERNCDQPKSEQEQRPASGPIRRGHYRRDNECHAEERLSHQDLRIPKYRFGMKTSHERTARCISRSIYSAALNARKLRIY